MNADGLFTPAQGRSPRVRGRPLHRLRARTRDGSIPAGAGETCLPPPTPGTRRVDPRGCGGDAGIPGAASGSGGRSPRVRGRHHRSDSDVGDVGSIPAGAGETATTSMRRRRVRVDPRGCGGDCLAGHAQHLRQGRSPRVRGRHLVTCLALAAVGSIPAGAGETRPRPASEWAERVDPRGCGGDFAREPRNSFRTGRSPRVRGRRAAIRPSRAAPRSIPAGAGETQRPATPTIPTRVDPRGCGGDRAKRRYRHARSGRSPRVRGRRRCGALFTHHPGSIPAGAGETKMYPPALSLVRVDPRGCGGDRSTRLAASLRQGRSPRVRGRPLSA